MRTITPKEAAAIVMEATEARENDEAIAAKLVAEGIPPSKAVRVAHAIRHGYRAGVQSMVYGTPAGSPDNVFYMAGFARGRAAMRFTTPAWVLLRMAWPYVLAAGIAGLIMWKMVF